MWMVAHNDFLGSGIGYYAIFTLRLLQGKSFIFFQIFETRRLQLILTIFASRYFLNLNRIS